MSDDDNPWHRARPKPPMDKRERANAARPPRDGAPRPARPRPPDPADTRARAPRESSGNPPRNDRPARDDARGSRDDSRGSREDVRRSGDQTRGFRDDARDSRNDARPPRHDRDSVRHAGARPRAPLDADAPGAGAEHAPRRNANEVRLYGINACRAAFDARPQDLRKVYLSETRIGALRDVLAWCVKHRLGYRVVETEDLDKLAQSTHHEGVIFEMRRVPQPPLRDFLHGLPDGAQLLLWLDGVGNPHNFGAVLRCAAHFGVAGVLLPQGSTLTVSGAAARVAEGGAEFVPVVTLGSTDDAVNALHASGFTLAATLPRDAESLYAASLPQRLVLVFGAEGEGLQPALVRACSLRLAIPGSGNVESLNIANAVGVALGEWWRRHRA